MTDLFPSGGNENLGERFGPKVRLRRSVGAKRVRFRAATGEEKTPRSKKEKGIHSQR